jgi:hypothetical protein
VRSRVISIRDVSCQEYNTHSAGYKQFFEAKSGKDTLFQLLLRFASRVANITDDEFKNDHPWLGLDRQTTWKDYVRSYFAVLAAADFFSGGENGGGLGPLPRIVCDSIGHSGRYLRDRENVRNCMLSRLEDGRTTESPFAVWRGVLRRRVCP